MENSKEQVIKEIVAMEWEMFQLTQNNGGRASCQDNYPVFCNMRHAQFDAWSEDACIDYYTDLVESINDGRNLIAEKYFHMMEFTYPEEYEAQKHKVRMPSPEAKAIAQEITDEMIAQTEEIYKKYPNVARGGRPLRSTEDKFGYTSVETYQRCELYTYSLQTLKDLRAHLYALKDEGKSLALMISENSVKSYGYKSINMD
ncbi:MAG: DUF4125 family protein [Lachnospiraceae bacterium]|nr:DUF4125 family protein [Lachnospiraceae bacterium]